MRVLSVLLWFGLVLAPGVYAAQSAQDLPVFTNLIKENAPAVVNISTTTKQKARGELPPGLEIPNLPDDHPLGEWLRRFFEGQGDPGDPRIEPFDARSLGSGFIISKDGYIITNHHVVADADEVIVRLNDRREMVAEVIGSDPRSDIALIRVEAQQDLPVLRLGHSKNVDVGEWVLAIGSPFGFDYSATTGIVSAKGRSLPSENYVPFIQTDAAINPGNSGGPLFDMKGEVVGINSQIYSRTGGFMGLAFAIPIEMAMDVVEQLKTKGRVTRGWLGVYIQEVTRELAQSFGLDVPRGALVARVLPGGPAEKSDLKIGDVILAFNGEPVNSSSELPPLVGTIAPGEAASLSVLREGKVQDIKVQIGELPEEDASILQGRAEAPTTKANALGLKVQALTDAQRSEIGLDEGGVLVTEVSEGPAQNAGLQEGDVIKMINGQKVTSVEVFDKLAADLPKDKQFVSVLVQREEGPQFLALEVPK